ncbi:MAG: Trk system potassium transporter TrkA [Deltaproteobacteria bacterium]|nr:Trk system potassium transporter TrkA [Deltaproteobacteria bacterium]
MKKIAIVGAGEIGTFLAERLTEEKNDVTVIDKDPQILAILQESMDVAGYLGNATRIEDLTAAGVSDVDLFIATTRQDETNLISCLLADELKVPHKIAVTRYLGLREQRKSLESRHLGIDLLVNSSEALLNEVLNLVETTGAAEVARFADGRIIFISFLVEEHSALTYLTVDELCGGDQERRFSVATILRDGALLEPSSDLVFKEGDYIYLLTTRTHLPELNDVLNVETIKSRTAIIAGDNFFSQILAGALINRHFHVTMLTSSDEKTQLLQSQFQNRTQFQVETGEGSDVKLLRRIKVPSTSVFIAANKDDSANLTACLVAKSLGVGKTIAIIRRHDLAPLCRRFGVDAHIAPHLATAKVVQEMVHENRVLSYRAVSQSNLEVIELEAMPKSRAVKENIGKLKLPPGVVIGGIASGERTTLPRGKDRIQPRDKVIVLTLPEHILEVEEIFGH